MGNRLLCGAFCLVPAIQSNLIAGYTTENEAFSACLTNKVDLLVCTDELEQGSAVSLIKRVKSASADTKTLMFTDRETEAVVRDAINAGANGVCFYSSTGLKDSGDFVPAVAAMNSGDVYYPPAVRKAAAFPIKPLPELSAREEEVLRALCMGLSNKAIAEELMLSIETVKTYVSQIISKLGATDRLSAVVTAIRSGF